MGHSITAEDVLTVSRWVGPAARVRPHSPNAPQSVKMTAAVPQRVQRPPAQPLHRLGKRLALGQQVVRRRSGGPQEGRHP